MTEIKDKNRLVRVAITPDLLVKMLEQGNEIHSEVIKGLPKTAEFIRAFIYDPMGNNTQVTINLIIYDDSFNEVEAGAIIPYFTPLMRSLPTIEQIDE